MPIPQQVEKSLEMELGQLFQQWGLRQAQLKARLLTSWLEEGEAFFISGKGEEGKERLEALREVLERHGYRVDLAWKGDTYFLFSHLSPSPREEREEQEAFREGEELRPPEELKALRGKVVREQVEPPSSVPAILYQYFPEDLKPSLLSSYGILGIREEVAGSLEERGLRVASDPSIIAQFSFLHHRLSRQLEENWYGVARGSSYRRARQRLAALASRHHLSKEDLYVLYNIDIYGHYANDVGKEGVLEDIVEEYLFFLNDENFDNYFSTFPPTWRGMVEWTARSLARKHAALLRQHGRDVDERALYHRYRAALAALMVVENAGGRENFRSAYTREWMPISAGGAERAPLEKLRKWYGPNPTIFTAEIVREGDRVRYVRRAYLLREGRIEVYEMRDGAMVHVDDVREVEATLSDGSTFRIAMEEENGQYYFKATPSPFIYIGGVNVAGEEGKERIVAVTHLNKVSYQWQNIQYNYYKKVDGKWKSKGRYLFTDISDIGLFQLTLKYALDKPFHYTSGGFAPPYTYERVEEDIELWGQRRVVERGQPFPEARLYIASPTPSAERVTSARGVVVGQGKRYLHIVADTRLPKDGYGYYMEWRGRRYHLSPNTTHIFALEKAGGGEGEKTILYNAYILVDGEGRLLDTSLLEGVEGPLASLDGKTLTLTVEGREMEATVMHVGTLTIGVEEAARYARGGDGLSLLLSQNFGGESMLSAYLSMPLEVAFDNAEGLPYVPFQPIGKATLLNEEGWDYQGWAVVDYSTANGPITDYGEVEWVVVEREGQRPEEPQRPEGPQEREPPREVPSIQYVLEDSFLSAEVALSTPPAYREELRAYPAHLFFLTEKAGPYEYVLNKEGKRVGLLIEGKVVVLMANGRAVELPEGWEDSLERAYKGSAQALAMLEERGYNVGVLPIDAMQLLHFREDSPVWDILYGDGDIALTQDGGAVLKADVLAKRGRTYTFHLLELKEANVRVEDGEVKAATLRYGLATRVEVRAVKEGSLPEGISSLPAQGEQAEGLFLGERFYSNLNVEVNYSYVGSLALAKLAFDSGNREEARLYLERAFSVVSYNGISLASLAKAYYAVCPQGNCDFSTTMARVAERLGIPVEDVLNAAAILLMQSNWSDAFGQEERNAMGAMLHAIGSTISDGEEMGNVDRLLDTYKAHSRYLPGVRALILSTGNVKVLMPKAVASIILPRFLFTVREETGSDSYTAFSAGAYLQFIYRAYQDGLYTMEVDEEGNVILMPTERLIRAYTGAGGLTLNFERKAGSFSSWVEVDVGLSLTVVEGGERAFLPTGGVSGGLSYIFGSPETGALVLSIKGGIDWRNVGELTVVKEEVDGETRLRVVSTSPGARFYISPSFGIIFPTMKVEGGLTIESRAGKLFGGPNVKLAILKGATTYTIGGEAKVGNGVVDAHTYIEISSPCMGGKRCRGGVSMGVVRTPIGTYPSVSGEIRIGGEE